MGDMNFASAWERNADTRGDQTAIQHGTTSRTWREFDQRAACLAGAFRAVGIGAGDNVALALYNGNEYLEAQFGAFKVRAAPVNVNYRYVEKELHYLIENSDAKAVIFDESLTERMEAVRPRLDNVRMWVRVGGDHDIDWAASYDELIARTEPAPRIERQSDDLWILYTGGTTGNPKGVMWPHGNIIQLSNSALAPLGLTAPQSLDELAHITETLDSVAGPRRQLAAAPLMHGTAGLTSLSALLLGGTVVTLTDRHFDPHELWKTVENNSITGIAIVGDVFCAPMVEALDEAAEAGTPYDLSSLQNITSSGVMWSQAIKDRLLAHARASGSAMICQDSLGASEGVGFAAKQSVGDNDTETAKFELGPNAAVFSDDGRRLQAGDDEIGLLAVTGPIPLGYYGDPVKSAETFREFEGQRWSVPGDYARIEADGTVMLLGRGSVSINTGGEKVYPEEVEEALKLHTDVVDANVVGVPDPKWGAAVTAVVEMAEGATVDDAALVESLRAQLSGYKLPKNVVRVDKIFRGPNGKADYRWAAATAKESLGITD